MIPNERPTPITDAEEYSYTDQDGIEQYVVKSDFARTLERSLAERTEERDKWANLAAQYSAEREHNANMALAYKADLDLMTQDRDSETRWAATYVKEKDTALAKLAKCRTALERVKQENEHFGYGFEDCRDKVIKTLEETK
jgi:hypothetical protein